MARRTRTTAFALSPADAKALRTANHAETKAKQDAELALLKSKVALLEAAQHKNAVLERLAATYRFDADGQYTFDDQTGMLTRKDS